MIYWPRRSRAALWRSVWQSIRRPLRSHRGRRRAGRRAFELADITITESLLIIGTELLFEQRFGGAQRNRDGFLAQCLTNARHFVLNLQVGLGLQARSLLRGGGDDAHLL